MRPSAVSWILCTLLLVGILAWSGASMLPKGRGEALIGGHFELTNPQGETVTEKDFAGKYTLVYFGFTHCPDICPTGLLLISNVLNQMGAKAKNIVPLFITLDPERDTPKVMGEYTGHFSKRLVGLSGTPVQVKQAAEAYKVYYRKVEIKDSEADYMIDHSGYLYLMGPDGKYIMHFPHQISESALQEGLENAVR